MILPLVLFTFRSEGRIKFSVEVEKVGRNHKDFIPYADLVFISKVHLVSYIIYNLHVS